MAALGMSLSSLLVVLNAMRLLKSRAPTPKPPAATSLAAASLQI